uniref:Uncharacterized protein n=1 Tax=viral metagenome TaxID=1070528 RepID=A0A6H1ZQI9_9ZZZZ
MKDFATWDGIFGLNSEPKRFTLKQVSEKTEIDVVKLRKMIHKGLIEAIKLCTHFGKCFYVAKNELKRLHVCIYKVVRNE